MTNPKKHTIDTASMDTTSMDTASTGATVLNATSMDMASTDIKRLGHLLDDALFILDSEARIREANVAAVQLSGRLFGRPFERPFGSLLDDRLVGMRITDVIDIPDFAKDFAAARRSGRIIEGMTARQDKSLRQFRMRLRRLDDGMIAMLLMDMTLQRNLEKVRRDFVANVSHELRSPLTALIGFIETLQSGDDLDAATRARFLGIMEEEAGRMSRLINDLMSLSRVEVEEHIAPTDIVYIKSVAGAVITSLGNRASKEDRGIIFRDTRKNPDDATVILGEVDEITEVFHNLLDNAIKYGHPNTDVQVIMVDTTDGSVRFDIINQGDGIEEKHLSRLTERFYRADKGRSRRMGGTGLGLAIVKHIVRRHRGELGISSQPMGETVFSITLPEYKAAENKGAENNAPDHKEKA